ncbi:MAG TPA: cytidine deaminase [Thermoanaerobaculia bacterium]|jgi:cytidine deaminase|nr:cytidine deaminase [Thermoanaerobaculia bacterium]
MLSNEQLSELESARQSAGGYVPAAAVERIIASGLPLEQLMLDLIPRAKQFAIPSISNFFVGAVAHGVSGNLYFGANYEFPGQALSFTVHGEQAATMHAISFNETGIDLLAVSAAPCGYCRQFLNELTSASTLQIILPNTPTTPLTALLPNAFGPTDLGVTAALMSPQSHAMTLDATADDVAIAALNAANASYAPYSLSYAGVALQTSNGSIYTGGIAENAAFNPSMSPLEAAIVALTINGGKTYSDITDAVLVQASASKACQMDATRNVLVTITKVPLRVYEAK